MPPMVPFAMIRQISIEKFGDIDPRSFGPAEAHPQRFCIQPEAVGDYIWVVKLCNQIGIEAKRYGAGAVASEDELVGACELVFVKVNYVFDNLAAMEIDCLSINGMRVKPLMKITCTVTNYNYVKTLLLEIISKHHPKVIVFCRAFHSGWTATVIVGINGNATTMDIDEPIVTFGVADIVVGGLFAIAAKCVR